VFFFQSRTSSRHADRASERRAAIRGRYERTSVSTCAGFASHPFPLNPDRAAREYGAPGDADRITGLIRVMAIRVLLPASASPECGLPAPGGTARRSFGPVDDYRKEPPALSRRSPNTYLYLGSGQVRLSATGWRRPRGLHCPREKVSRKAEWPDCIHRADDRAQP